MKNCNFNRIHLRRLLTLIGVMLFVSICLCVPAFASDVKGDPSKYDATQSILGTIIRTVRLVAIPIAVVAVAWQGFNFMRNEKTAEQAIARIKIIAVSLASVYLLASALALGVNAGKTSGVRWDPDNPNANVLVQPYKPKIDWADFVDTDDVATGLKSTQEQEGDDGSSHAGTGDSQYAYQTRGQQ